jgi:hypothetical protein
VELVTSRPREGYVCASDVLEPPCRLQRSGVNEEQQCIGRESIIWIIHLVLSLSVCHSPTAFAETSPVQARSLAVSILLIRSPTFIRLFLEISTHSSLFVASPTSSSSLPSASLSASFSHLFLSPSTAPISLSPITHLSLCDVQGKVTGSRGMRRQGLKSRRSDYQPRLFLITWVPPLQPTHTTLRFSLNVFH